MHQGMTSSDVLDTTLAVQLAPGVGHPAAGPRRPACRAQAPCRGAQVYPDDRAQPRHPRRAGDLRAQAGAGLRRVRPLPEAARSGARGDRHLRDHAARWAPSPTSPPRSRTTWPTSSACRPSRSLPRSSRATATPMFFATLGVIASVDRTARGGGPPPAAHRGARGRGIFLAGAEGLERDAAQAQPGADREPHRPGADDPLLCDPGDGERRAVARARHLAPRRSSASSAPTRRSRSTSRSRRLTGWSTSRCVYPERMQKNLDRMGGLVHSQRVLLALTQAGRGARRRLPPGPAQRDEGLGKRRPAIAARAAQGRSRGHRGAAGGRARGEVRPRLPLQAGRPDLRSRCSARARRPRPSRGAELGDATAASLRRANRRNRSPKQATKEDRDADHPHDCLGSAAGRAADLLDQQLEPRSK